MPNERWQSDFTHYPLAGGADTEILTWLDDHSRYALSVTAHARVTGPAVLLAFRAACEQHGAPASTLTDNGMVFTTRLSGGKGGRNGLEHELRRLGDQAEERQAEPPPDPGKVERFQQTMKNWLRAQPRQPATLAELQSLLDAFAGIYNTRRPHRSLEGRATPAAAYAARPKAVPGDRAADTHDRVRTDRIDTTGLVTLRHQRQALPHRHRPPPRRNPRPAPSPGPAHPRHQRRHRRAHPRAHPRPRPSDYQPTGKPAGWPKKTPRPLRGFAVSSMSCDITLARPAGFEPADPLLGRYARRVAGRRQASLFRSPNRGYCCWPSEGVAGSRCLLAPHSIEWLPTPSRKLPSCLTGLSRDLLYDEMRRGNLA